MQYRVTLTVETEDLMPGAWPDVSIEVQCAVSVIPEDPEAYELIGRVVRIDVARVEAN